MEQNNLITRRSFVLGALSSLALLVLPNVSGEEKWTPEKQIVLDPTKPFDLTKTLPKGVRSGGRFSVDLDHGTHLPDGIRLSEDGFLHVNKHFSQNISGVVFSYEEPQQKTQGVFRG